MKIVISEQPVEIHAMRHMREYIQIMQQRGTTVNYSANKRSGFLFSTSVYNEKKKKKKRNKIEKSAPPARAGRPRGGGGGGGGVSTETEEGGGGGGGGPAGGGGRSFFFLFFFFFFLLIGSALVCTPFTSPSRIPCFP